MKVPKWFAEWVDAQVNRGRADTFDDTCYRAYLKGKRDGRKMPRKPYRVDFRNQPAGDQDGQR